MSLRAVQYGLLSKVYIMRNAHTWWVSNPITLVIKTHSSESQGQGGRRKQQAAPQGTWDSHTWVFYRNKSCISVLLPQIINNHSMQRLHAKVEVKRVSHRYILAQNGFFMHAQVFATQKQPYHKLWIYKCIHRFLNVCVTHLPSFVSFRGLVRVYWHSRFKFS